DAFKNPGDTVQVRVRLNGSGCGTLTKKLHITSKICAVDTSATISMDLIPPLPLTAKTIDFGVNCKPRDSSIIVVNPNDRPVRLDTILTDNNFFADPTLLLPNVIPPHDSIRVPCRFFPSVPADGDYTDTMLLR